MYFYQCKAWNQPKFVLNFQLFVDDGTGPREDDSKINEQIKTSIFNQQLLLVKKNI